MAKTLLVCGLEQSWAEMAMDLDASPDHSLRTITQSSRLPAFLFHLRFIGPTAARLRRAKEVTKSY